MSGSLRTLLGDVVSARGLRDCLEALASSRAVLGCAAVGFRDLVDVPAIERLQDKGVQDRGFGWSPSFLDTWRRRNLGREFPLPPGIRVAGQTCRWDLPDPDRGAARPMSPPQRAAIRLLRDHGVVGGLSATVRRPFGGVGCVTWFLAGGEADALDEERRRALWLFAQHFFDGIDRSWLRRDLSPLTLRESEVLCLAARGYTDDQIGATLGRSGNTVRFHIKSIIRKLGAVNRTHAVAIAVAEGLLEPELLRNLGGPAAVRRAR